MKLKPEQRRIVHEMLANQSLPFSELVKLSGVDKRTAFVGADLRGVDFKVSDLSGFNFARADLTGADMTNTSGQDRLVLTGAILKDARGVQRLSDETRDAPDLPTLVRIPAGAFLMGAPAAENKREKIPKEIAAWTTPQRPMTIRHPFWLGKYPVTRGQFRAFVEATGYDMSGSAVTYEPGDDGKWVYEHRPGRDWLNPGFEQTDDHPVVCVSHTDALAYIEWLRDRTGHDYRLPSEAEWEWAARAGTTAARYWGDGRDQATRYAQVRSRSLLALMKRDFDPDEFFPGDTGYAFTAPVGSFLPNPFGLYDVLGNVWEWCADTWSASLRSLPSDGMPNSTLDSNSRVLRGGSWDDGPGGVRAAGRSGFVPGYRGSDAGFRVARTLP